MTEKLEQRWISPAKTIYDRLIGHAGSLDLFVGDMADGNIIIEITCDPMLAHKVNFTLGEYTEDGHVMFFDKDVVPTPYEMCLIYQMMGDYRDRET